MDFVGYGLRGKFIFIGISLAKNVLTNPLPGSNGYSFFHMSDFISSRASATTRSGVNLVRQWLSPNLQVAKKQFPQGKSEE